MMPLTVLCGLDGPRVADLGAGLLLRGDRLALVHLDPAGADRGSVECRVTDSAGRFTRQHVELSHDCVSCTLRETTALVVRRLIGTRRYDAVLIQLHPGIEAAAAVAGLDEELAGDARVDTVVLDLGAGWLAQLGSRADVTDAGIAVVDGDDREVAGVLASDLDAASVVVLGGPARREHSLDTHAALGALCPDARRTYPSTALDLRLTDAVRTGTYDPAVRRLLTRGGLLSPRSHYLSSRPRLTLVRWSAGGPLHPERLHDALDVLADGVLRSSGRLWLASQPELAIGWDSAGERLALGPEARWPQPLSAPRGSRPRPGWGGRHNIVAFLGEDLDEAAVRETLDGCLLTPAELTAGVDSWRRLPDPFARWGGPSEDAGAA